MEKNKPVSCFWDGKNEKLVANAMKRVAAVTHVPTSAKRWDFGECVRWDWRLFEIDVFSFEITYTYITGIGYDGYVYNGCRL